MVSLLLCACLCAEMHADASMERWQEYLDQLNAFLPESPAWTAWLKESGELPPDFASMRPEAELPNPLARLNDGSLVTRPEDWPAQRQALLAEFHRWILGTVPPTPDNMTAQVLSEREETGVTVREVELRFGKDHLGKLYFELMIPKGAGPFPVFMTQDNHRAWALIAVRRGYIGCVYAGADSRDDTPTFLEAFPGYDWSKLVRRAWAASRCVDYLIGSVPQANAKQIVITGHSRNGKTSLMASALDERFAAVISSSSGVGGCMPSRYCGEPHFAEGIENITRAMPDWFHPRWRFFVGREQYLPVDLHELVALSAPRPCLLSIAYNDDVESAWAMEEAYLAIKPAWALHHAEDKLRILWRPMAHETWPTIIERYVDWCDAQFGRGAYEFPERLIYPHDWNAWRQHAEVPNPANFPARAFGADAPASREAWETRTKTIRAAVENMLGSAPEAPARKETYGKDPRHIEVLLGRDEAGKDLEKDNFVFGEYINADVYMPKGTEESKKRIPAVLWLHPFSLSEGYVAGYRRGEQAYRTFARTGMAVFCYDQIGTGRRIEEIEHFYDRYPKWSVLGKMVRDAREALDVMRELPYVDPDRIYVVGYNLGAMVALHLAALDARPACYALVCPPPPFRLDTDVAMTGGIRRWSRLPMLLPQLDAFVGQEAHVPYDVDELVAAMAPRPTLVVTPKYDREAPIALARQGLEAARKIFALCDAKERLTQQTPDAYNHFDTKMQEIVAQWLKER